MKNYTVCKIINLDLPICYYCIAFGKTEGLLKYFKNRDCLHKLFKDINSVALQKLNVSDNKQTSVDLCEKYIKDKNCLNKGVIEIYDKLEVDKVIEKVDKVDEVDEKPKVNYEENPNRIDYKKRYYLQNKEQILAKDKERKRLKRLEVVSPEIEEQRKLKKKEYRKKYYEKHKNVILSRNKKYYEKNIDKIRELHREYYRENKVELYANRDKEQMKKKHKEWLENNKEKVLEYQKQYYENNKARHVEWSREYYHRVTKLKKSK